MREWRRQMRGASNNERAAKLLHHRFLELLLDAVELHRWQELPIGKLRQVLSATANADETLYMVVPRGQVVVTNGPVDGDAVARIRLEIHRAPPVALAAPRDRTTADLIAAYPVEPLLFDVGIIQFIDEPMLGRLRAHVAGSRRDRLMAKIFGRGAPAVRQFPRVEQGRRIVTMPDHASAIEDQCL